MVRIVHAYIAYLVGYFSCLDVEILCGYVL
jgi:hypothetical protein